MVCRTKENRTCVIIYDGEKYHYPVLPTTPVNDLFNFVEERCKVPENSYKLHLVMVNNPAKLDLSTVKKKTMSEVGVDFSAEPESNEVAILMSDSTEPNEEKYSDQDLPIYNYNLSALQPSVWSGESSSYKNVSKPEINYVGLVNQAMTCYLNSLLQALYMTPEFRNALYNWEYVEGSEKDEANSIPYQLQKLFLNLQTSSKHAVETTSLTKSFGWDSTEAWQQHDIQELCRVMFDALEQKFKNTEQADLINRLYEGKMIDYVKCLECGTEKSREDTFLDIPLPVRRFGSTVAYTRVEEALKAFVQYEILEGNNQYHCEKCNKKCNAHKGLKFTKFPYLLTLHLKRFDFDYSTFHRIKLNDKVKFPNILNLNPFISTVNLDSPICDDDVGLSVKCDDGSTADSGTLDDDCPPCDTSLTNSNHSTNHDDDDDEGIDMSNGISTKIWSELGNGKSNCSSHNHENEKDRENCIVQGPHQYELFSIMIHSGSASGGHYYAYIKDFRTNNWLCFNDQSVTPITHEDIKKSYGGGPTRAYYSGAYSSSTNAYMLMYRQIDPERNALPMQVEDFPPHIQELLKKMKENEDNDKKNHEKPAQLPRLKVYCHHPSQLKLVSAKVYTMSNSTLADATEDAYQKMNLEGIVDLDQCRLLAYDSSSDFIECSFEGKEQEPITSIAEKATEFLLEIRPKDKEFEVYPPGGVATKVFVIDVVKRELVDGPINVRGLLSQTVKEYKQMLGKIINMDPKQMKLAVRKSTEKVKLIDQDDDTLLTQGFHCNKVFVSTALDTCSSKSFFQSTFYEIIENLEYVISLQVELPDNNKELLEKLDIPVLESKPKENEKVVTNGLPKPTLSEPQKEIVMKCTISKDGKIVETEDSFERNVSPQLGETDEWNTPEQSNSEESSLNDSDKTLVGVAPYDDDDDGDDYISRMLRDQDSERLNRIEIDEWDTNEAGSYFKVTPHPDCAQIIKISVNNTMQLGTFKKHLEPFVGVPAEYFRVFRQWNRQLGETELNCLTEQLNCEDGERLRLRLGRALRNDEFRVKLYQLLIDSSEPYKFLCEWTASKDMTVSQAKKDILTEIKRKYDINIPYERCRLRKKNYKTASKVFLDDQTFKDILLYSQFELIVQELPDKEIVTDSNQILLFVRRWSPSEMKLGPFQEIVMDTITINDKRTTQELKEKISSISGLPVETIEVAKGKGSFPCEISVLKIQHDIDWIEHLLPNNTWALSLEDGSVLLYRDKTEKLKELSPDEVKEIVGKESSRLMSLSSTSSYSPRRERALKIHLDPK